MKVQTAIDRATRKSEREDRPDSILGDVRRNCDGHGNPAGPRETGRPLPRSLAL